MFVCAQHMQLDLNQSKYLHNTLHKQGLLLKRAILPQHTILLQTSQRVLCFYSRSAFLGASTMHITIGKTWSKE